MFHIPPQPWTGRIDGDGPEHARWHSTIQPLHMHDAPGTVAPGSTCLLYTSPSPRDS